MHWFQLNHHAGQSKACQCQCLEIAMIIIQAKVREGMLRHEFVLLYKAYISLIGLRCIDRHRLILGGIRNNT